MSLNTSFLSGLSKDDDGWKHSLSCISELTICPLKTCICLASLVDLILKQASAAVYSRVLNILNVGRCRQWLKLLVVTSWGWKELTPWTCLSSLAGDWNVQLDRVRRHFEYSQFGGVGWYLVEVVLDCTYFSYSNADFCLFTPTSSVFWTLSKCPCSSSEPWLNDGT